MVDTPDRQPQPDVIAARPRRRRRRPVVYLVVAGILWFIGQGVGWFGSGPSGERGQEGESGSGSSQSHAPVAGGAVSSAATVTTGVLTSAGGGTAPSQIPNVDAPGEQPPAAHTANETDLRAASVLPVPQVADSAVVEAKVMSADRFESLLSLLESHLRDGALGSASAALQQLNSQSLSVEQRASFVEIEQRLQPLRLACEQRILEHVRNGEVLSADQQAAQLVVGGIWSSCAQLRDAGQLAGGDSLGARIGARADTVGSQPQGASTLAR